MGFAIGRAAREAGPVVLVPRAGGRDHAARVRRIGSPPATAGGHRAQTPGADIFIAAAAVADWRPVQADQKIKKDGSGNTPMLAFTENPDILATVAKTERAKSGALFCVGFAAESHDLVKHAKAKRERKGIPLLVGNIGPLTFGQDDNQMLLVDAQGTTELPRASKIECARRLVAEIATRLGSRR
jgi:phosphopantothenoylcysteine decarboxylase/phosphopantothenate--cysteine ligase